jgi:predicted dehydrogenase
VLDMSIHHLDLLRAITGREVETVYARSWRAPDSPYEHDPAVAAIMTLDGGTTVTYRGDWASRGTDTSWDGDWEILGKHGRLTWSEGADSPEHEVVTLRQGDEAPERIEAPQLTHTDRAGVLQAFRRAVGEGGPVETSAADNINSLAVVLACIESIETGAPVEVAAFLAGSSEPVA